MKLHVVNEYDTLEAVLVHRPGQEIDRLTHHSMRDFLFEDIPFLRRMQEEHDAFVDVMKKRDIQVIYLEHLLSDLLEKDPAARRTLIEQVCVAEQAGGLVNDLLDQKLFPDDALLEILFAGITHAEYQEHTGRRVLTGAPLQTFVLPPIPNIYFTRDPAVVVGGAAISCKMHFAARMRESILVRAVLEHHPEFAGQPITYGGSDAPTEDRPFTIEGGDVIVLNEESVLVGVSERTRSETIEVLARRTFEIGRAKRFYEIPIPTERIFMHLDTVCTIVDRATVVWYPGVMDNIKYIHHYESDASGGVVRKPDSRGLAQILSDEFGREVRVVRTGGGSEHYAGREQRTDGTNTLAIAPGVACTYERNVKTIEAMEKAGIECITVAGSELVRGLGGPRCMTMPLRRRPPDGR
ncbi:MAG: arginine deiminase family protein [Planctomycetota bacterium]|nr:arginine deiminase family protein [Planctomycetota bacterium]